MMDDESFKKVALGDAAIAVAEAWFRLLGFAAVTGVFHAAAQKTDLPGLIGIKWICYVLMFIWLQYKIDAATWFLFPTTNPVHEKAKSRHLSIALSISFAIAYTLHLLLSVTIEVLLKTNGPA